MTLATSIIIHVTRTVNFLLRVICFPNQLDYTSTCLRQEENIDLGSRVNAFTTVCCATVRWEAHFRVSSCSEDIYLWLCTKGGETRKQPSRFISKGWHNSELSRLCKSILQDSRVKIQICVTCTTRN